MPRTLAAPLTAALGSGSFEAVIRVEYIASPANLSCTVVRYKQKLCHLAVDFYLPDERLAAGNACIRLIRGVKISGVEYTVTSAWYYADVCNQTKKLVHFEGNLWPVINPGNYQSDLTYNTVIQAWFDDAISLANQSLTFAYRDNSLPWLNYQFDAARSEIRLRRLDEFLSLLKQKRFIYITDDQDNQVLVTSAGDDIFLDGIDGNHDDPDHELTPTLLDTQSLHSNEINYIWTDETGVKTIQTNYAAHSQHDLGYLETGCLPPASTVCAIGNLVKLPINLTYLTGDSMLFHLTDGTDKTLPILVTEVFDSTKYPAWYVTIEPIPYAPDEDGPDTTDYNVPPGATILNEIEWFLEVDWNGDGSWTGSTELEYIFHMHIKRGRKERMTPTGQRQPDGESLTIKMYDPNRRYDRFNSSGPLYTYLGRNNIALRVLASCADLSMVKECFFVGTLTEVDYNIATATATIKGSGLSKLLESNAAEILTTPCQPVTGGHDSYFVADGSTPFPVNYWRGRTGGLPLRECVALTLTRAAWPFSAYYGDGITNYEQPDFFFFHAQSAWATLKELADAFCARLFFLRDGRLFAMDRSDEIGLNGGATPNSNVVLSAGLDYPAPYEALRNEISVNVRAIAVTPFKAPYLEAYYLPAWTNNGPVEIAPLETLEIDIQYPSGLDRPMQGSFVDVNGSGYPVNYEAWSAADKTGTRMDASGTGQGEFAIIWETIPAGTVPYGNNQKWCRIKLKNYSTTLTCYFFNLKVMLIGMRETGNPIVSKYVNTASVTGNGSRPLLINSRWVQTRQMADAIAQAYRSICSTREMSSPATITYGMTNGTNLATFLRDHDLGTHLQFGAAGGTYSNLSFGMHGRHMIVGQELIWRASNGQKADVKLTFEKALNDFVAVIHERSTSTNSGATPQSSLTKSVQVDERPARVMVVLVAVRAFASVDTLTYNGQALTRHSSIQAGTGNNPRAELWYLVNPPVGTFNLVTTLTGADFFEVVALNFYNVHQTSPFRTTVTGSAASGNPSVTVASQTGDKVIDIISYTGTSATLGAGRHAIGTVTSDGNWKLSCSKEDGAASVVMDWTTPSASAWAQIGVSLRAVSG